jgi:hypothetical protein
MKKIGFLSNKLTLRGTEVNLYDYADHNETLLNNKSIIITRPINHVKKVSPRDVSELAYEKFNKRFTVEYYINYIDIVNIVKKHNIDVLFIEKAGSPKDGLVFNCCKTIIHAVFTTKEPHGDLYCPISDQLNKICNTNYPVLPYMVKVFNTNDNLKKELNIPDDAIVFGSYSGADEYTNIDVKKTVIDVVNNPKYKNIYFIYLNIDKFGPDSNRLIFLPGTADMYYKRKFINTCDAMLYARNGGETFGLACGEFSICNKPIILCPGQNSNAHEVILGDDAIKFKNYDELFDIITNWSKYNKDVSNNGYKKYTPIKVMEIFNKSLDVLIPNNQINYVPNSIVFVTAFKDIGRNKWNTIPRTNEEYIKTFLNLANNIEYKLVVFVENDIYNTLKTYNFNSNIIFVLSSKYKTYYETYLLNEKKMINSTEYKNKIPLDRKRAPEHWCAEYNLVNHSKINYISHTKKKYPNYEYYAWIDFGCIRKTIDDVPKNIDFSKLKKKICYLSINTPPNNKINSNDMLKSHTVYLAGSQFITHNTLVEKHESLYTKQLERWKNEIICDDDQNAILQIYFDNKELFHIYSGNNEWFSLFRLHLNSNIILDNKLDITKLINIHNFNGTYVEIGVARGEFTKHILKNTNLSKFYLIDPYKNFTIDEYNDAMNFYNMDNEFSICKNNLKEFESKITYIRKTSSEAVNDIKDNSVDVIYIDGNHSYSYVIQDLRNYWSKLRIGGLMLGDDLYESSDTKDVLKIWDNKSLETSKSFGLFGVHSAVIDFCKENKLKYNIFSNQFMIYKF